MRSAAPLAKCVCSNCCLYFHYIFEHVSYVADRPRFNKIAALTRKDDPRLLFSVTRNFSPPLSQARIISDEICFTCVVNNTGRICAVYILH
jgi:hypothetical protein